MLFLLSACALILDADVAARMDLDGDGVRRPQDCDDDDAKVGAERAWFVDADGDGYGSSATVTRCEADDSVSERDGDCDDDAASASPGAPELCNNADDDCDTVVDDGADKPTWYFDGDGDGFGTPFNTVSACTTVDGYVASNTDCNDADATLNPDTLWYPDADGDGYGDTTLATAACAPPDGFLRVGGDCDETRADVSPAAAELCDALNEDEDCDGVVEDADDGATAQTAWYQDLDTDGFGWAIDSVAACDEPEGYVGNRRDCDDGTAAVTTECRWAQVSAGVTHTCGRHEDGSVECWGFPTTSPSAALTFVDVSAGASFACGVLTDGTLTCWGEDHRGDTTPPAGEFTQVRAAFYTACALTTEGAIACWGLSADAEGPPAGVGFVSVDVAIQAGCALGPDGSVTGWFGAASLAGPFVQMEAIYGGCSGLDAAGEIDDAADTFAGVAPAGPFASYSVHWLTGCALDAAGAATCWGYDSYGQAQAPEGSFQSVSVGYHHACAITTDGFMACWGESAYGATTPPSD